MVTNNLQIYSGMVATRTGAETVTLADGATANNKPVGLFALDRNVIIDDTQGLDNVPFAVWSSDSTGFFNVSAPAFDTTQSYTVATTGARTLLYAGTGSAIGKLTSAAGAGNNPVAELWEVISPTTITVRLLAQGTGSTTLVP